MTAAGRSLARTSRPLSSTSIILSGWRKLILERQNNFTFTAINFWTYSHFAHSPLAISVHIALNAAILYFYDDFFRCCTLRPVDSAKNCVWIVSIDMVCDAPQKRVYPCMIELLTVVCQSRLNFFFNDSFDVSLL